MNTFILGILLGIVLTISAAVGFVWWLSNALAKENMILTSSRSKFRNK